MKNNLNFQLKLFFSLYTGYQMFLINV